MTRQMYYVFFGASRPAGSRELGVAAEREHNDHGASVLPHESPVVMTLPLVILAVCAALLGVVGTPAWPWFDSFLNNHPVTVSFAGFFENGILGMMILSSLIVFAGLGMGWWFYGRKPIAGAKDPDALERLQPQVFHLLQHKFYVDEFYQVTFIRANEWLAQLSDWFDRWIWNGAVWSVSHLVLGLSLLARSADTYIVNPGFDRGCDSVTVGGKILARLQNGRTQNYLRLVGLAFAVLALFLIWSGAR
jgi:NADH-quinone oxidoreductase subunit L